MKSGERIGLVQQLAILVPSATQFLAAADVRDRDDPAAIEQRQKVRAELRIVEMPYEPYPVTSNGAVPSSLVALRDTKEIGTCVPSFAVAC